MKKNVMKKNFEMAGQTRSAAAAAEEEEDDYGLENTCNYPP